MIIKLQWFYLPQRWYNSKLQWWVENVTSDGTKWSLEWGSNLKAIKNSDSMSIIITVTRHWINCNKSYAPNLHGDSICRKPLQSKITISMNDETYQFYFFSQFVILLFVIVWFWSLHRVFNFVLLNVFFKNKIVIKTFINHRNCFVNIGFNLSASILQTLYSSRFRLRT